MQNIRITELFFENCLYRKVDVENNFYNGSFRLHIYLPMNKTLIHNSLYVFDNWGGGGI